MQKENQTFKITPANRLEQVSEYYFSRKLKEVAQMNAEGKNVISLGIGSPDMPPSEETIRTLCENTQTGCTWLPAYCRYTRIAQSDGRLVQTYLQCRPQSSYRDTALNRFKRRYSPCNTCFCKSGRAGISTQSGLSHIHLVKQTVRS